jgi:acetyl esterase/lipase
MFKLIALMASSVVLVAAARPRSVSYRVHKDLVYAVHTHKELKADVYIPNGQGPFPGVLTIHGGGWAGGKPRHMKSIAKRLARRGYVVVNIAYRFAPEHHFPAQVHDVKAAVRWMRSKAAELKLDPERIGAFGYSAGGHLAAMLGLTDPSHRLEGHQDEGNYSSRVQAVVAGGLPANFTVWPNSPIITEFIGKSYKEAPEVWKLASPSMYVSKDDAPTFLYHGAWDKLVEPEQSKFMRAALQDAGVPVELHMQKARGHILAFVFDGLAVKKAIAFLDKHLKNS